MYVEFYNEYGLSEKKIAFVKLIKEYGFDENHIKFGLKEAKEITDNIQAGITQKVFCKSEHTNILIREACFLGVRGRLGRKSIISNLFADERKQNMLRCYLKEEHNVELSDDVNINITELNEKIFIEYEGSTFNTVDTTLLDIMAWMFLKLK